MNKSTTSWLAGLFLCLALSGGATVQAAERATPQRPPLQAAHMDTRFNHNHAYPSMGNMTRSLPSGAVSTRYRGSPYYFHGGSWYRPVGGRYVVVGAPLGLLVPFLPPFYTTVWFGDIPYYYANDAYYLWDNSQQGYVITNPPQDPATATTAPPSSGQLYIYPKNGQTDDQQSRDRYECHLSALQQSGFDPTQPAGGVGASQVDAKRQQYRQLERSCLEARGYAVN